MDGSVATGVSLRMRSELQRMYRTNSDSGNSALFDELLRVADSPKIELRDDTSSPSDSKSTDSLPVPQSDAPSSTCDDRQGCAPEKDVKAEKESESESSETDAALSATAVILQSTQITPVQDVNVETTTDTSQATTTSAVNEDASLTNSLAVDTKEIATGEATDTGIVNQQNNANAVQLPKTDTSRSGEKLVGNDRNKRSARQDGSLDAKVKSASETNSTHATAAHDEVKSRKEVREEQAPHEDRHAIDAQQSERAVEDSQQSRSDDSRGDKSDRSERVKWYMADNESKAATDKEASASDANNNVAPTAQETARQSDTNTSQLSSVTDLGIGNGSVVSSDAINALAALAARNQSSSATPDVVASASRDSKSKNESISAVNGASASKHASNTGSIHGAHSTGTSIQRTQSGSAEVMGQPDDPNAATTQLDQQDRVRLVQRVARSFSRLGPDGGQVSLKLHPPELGVLNVQVRMEGNTMSARLKTETPAAREAILENLPVLKERLAEQGVEIEQFQVEVSSGTDFATDSQGNQAFTGGSSGGNNQSTRGDIDYRRFTRDNLAADSSLNRSRSSQVAPWLGGSSAERTLDIKV